MADIKHIQYVANMMSALQEYNSIHMNQPAKILLNEEDFKEFVIELNKDSIKTNNSNNKYLFLGFEVEPSTKVEQNNFDFVSYEDNRIHESSKLLLEQTLTGLITWKIKDKRDGYEYYISSNGVYSFERIHHKCLLFKNGERTCIEGTIEEVQSLYQKIKRNSL